MSTTQDYVRENRVHAIVHETLQDFFESIQTLRGYHTARKLVGPNRLRDLSSQRPTIAERGQVSSVQMSRRSAA